MTRLKETYQKEIVKGMTDKFGYKNVMQVPKLAKIVINMGIGEAKENSTKILAVTSCPTGIAHTYMAAEGIEKAAKAKNCFVKIETRGSGGAKNVLTEQEIQDADCIIVAADAQVPMDRFDGKKVIPFSTHAGWPGSVIKDMTELAENKGATVENGHAFLFTGGDDGQSSAEGELSEWIESLK